MIMKKWVALLMAVLSMLCADASVWTVTNKFDSGVGSMRWAIGSAQNGDQVVFQSSLLTSGGDSIVLQSSISSIYSITVTGLVSGNDTLFISGGGTVPVFDVVSGSLQLDSLHIRNALSTLKGGAINFHSNDSLVLNYCSFKNCSSTSHGGAISSDSGYVEVNYSDLSYNQADLNGGGLSMNGGVLFIENSTINHNVSISGAGGGISAEVDSIRLISSTVNNNSSNQKGGGVYVFTHSPRLWVEQTLINSNFSSGAGAGIYTVSAVNGNTKLTLINSRLDSNTTNNYGGGMYSLSYGVSLIQILNSSVTGNTSLTDGGGVYAFNSNFSNSGIQLDIEKSTISYNTSLFGNMGGIGCYSHQSSKINVTTSTISNNSASINGGGVFTFSETDTAELNVTKSTMVYNSAGVSGGGIMGYSASSQPQARTKITFSSSVFGLNTGGDIYNIVSPSFYSEGYNVFSNTSSFNTMPTDKIGRDSVSMNLSDFGFYGGSTQTRIPLMGSSVINAGNPNDTSSAQNGVVLGIRDAGAAEGCNSYYYDYQTACDSFTWMNGVTYYQNTTGEQIVFPGSNGCDSVIVLDLTLSNWVGVTDVVSACGPYTWINGVTYNQSISGPQDTLQTVSGCDSIITLDLTVNTVNTNVFKQADSLISLAVNAQYQWKDCETGFDIPGANKSTFKPSENGVYQVEVTQNGCVDTSNCVPVTNVGIVSVVIQNNIHIYPNPVQDQLNIEITNWPATKVKIVVRDASGKQVFTQEIEPMSNQEILNVNTSQWAKGTYFIEVGFGQNRVVEKIVVN